MVRILEIIAAMGVAQGVLLLVLVALRFRYRQNVPLALLIIVLSVRLGTIPLWNADAVQAARWLIPVTTPLPFLFGFFIWWYVRELQHQEIPHTIREMSPHAILWLVDTIAMTALVVALGHQRWADLVDAIFSASPPWWFLGRNGLKVAVNVVYMTCAVRLAFRRNPTLTDAQRLWLRTLAVVPLVSLGAFAVVALWPGASAGVREGRVVPFMIVAITLLLIIYGVSLLALLAPRAMAPGCGGLLDEECRDLAAQVEALLENGAYQDSELTVRSVAQQLQVHHNRLSRAVNSSLHISFPRLVNRYRVRYVQQVVSANRDTGRTMLDIAMDAGFPSKSTFNRVFREETGMTPTEYLRNQPENR